MNNIILAPSTNDVDAIYSKWQSSHLGSREDFYNFFTTPSVERDQFLCSLTSTMDFKGKFVTVDISTKMITL